MKALVLNSGTHPEPAHLAAALVRRGHEVTYMTSASFAMDGRVGRFSRANRVAPSRLGRQLRRRMLPSPLGSQNVVLRSSVLELFSQVVRRAVPPVYDVALGARVLAFRAASRRFVRMHGSQFDLIVGQQTCSVGAFEAATSRNVCVLNCAIAHHRWVSEVMEQEKGRNPDWSSHAQGDTIPPAEEQALDREVELADAILAASTLTKRSLMCEGVSAERILIQPLGADVSEFGSAGEQLEQADQPSGLRVLFVGQLNQRKGLSYLLEAFDSANLPDAQLRLVGHGTPEAVEQVRSRHPNAQVLGPKSKHELGALYRWADVLVLPSLAEGFGLTAVEAMSMGTPVVVSTHTFATDLFEDGEAGRIIEPADARQLADVLRDLAAHPQSLERMGQSARRIARGLTWERYGDGAAEQLEALVERKRVHN